MKKVYETKKELSANEVSVYYAFQFLFSYINSLIPRCPVCTNQVKLSWGWCPYHGTISVLVKFVDKDNDGRINEADFIRYLENPNNVQGPDKNPISMAEELNETRMIKQICN